MTAMHCMPSRYLPIARLKHLKPYHLTIIAFSLILSSTANADDRSSSGASSSTGQLEEIVVTARNRREVLQDVPLAVSAISSDQIDEARIQDIRDLTSSVPGLAVTDQGGGYQSRPIIRGISQTNIFGSGDSNVSTFLDGVYIYNPSVINISLFDVDRVEVVKGPVSALYGRNAFAGAINYVTPVPSDKTTAKVSVSGGSQRRADGTLNLGGAIIPGVLDARFGIGYQTSNGYWSDPNNGRQLNGFRKRGVELALRYKPTDKLTADLLLFYNDQNIDPPAVALLPFTCAPVGGANQRFCGELPRGNVLPAPVEYPAKNGQSDTGLTEDYRTVHLKLDYDLGFARIDSISAWSLSHARQYISFDFQAKGLPFPLTPGPGTANIRTYIGEAGLARTAEYSEEIRLSSNQDQRLRWSVGGFFYRVDAQTLVQIGMDLSQIPPGQAVNNYFTSIWGTSNGQPSNATTKAIQRTDQRSGFGSIDLDIVPAVTASGELRYTSSPLHSQQVSVASFPSQTVFPFIQTTENSVSGRFTLRYKPSESLMFYASAANGTHDGGFNANAVLPQDRTFGPEKNKTYEIGVKSSIQNRFVIDAAIFYSKLNDLQILGPASDAPLNPALVYKNYGSGSAKGFEIEAQGKIIPGLTASVGFAYTDPKFGDGTFNTSAGDVAACAAVASCASRISTFHGLPAIDISGQQIIYASKEQLNVSLDAKFPINAEWNWFARADYAYLSKYFFTLNDYQWVGDRVNVNATAGLSSSHWRVALWAKNLTNDLTPTFSAANLRLNDFRFQDNAYLPDGRSYGVAVSYKY